MGIQVLLIEDDETIAEPLAEGLQNYGFSVSRVATGAEGLQGPYGEVVLLDLGLPDMDGIDVCRGIRQVSDVPVIILTARGEEADRILGLELGADDYLAKPFSLRELIARIRAVTRRSQRTSTAFGTATGGFAPMATASYGHDPAPQTPPSDHPPAYGSFTAPASLAYVSPLHEALGARETAAYAGGSVGGAIPGPLVVDRRTRQVWVGESLIALTPKEFDLLALLCEDPGAVYSRQQILNRVWDPHYEGPTKTLDVHVATLRRKLGHPHWIQTLRGVGFRLAVAHAGPGDSGHGYGKVREVAFP
ncbi:response regulator transcription factor [Streptomyces coeruleorubidus]|uniref:response regulator transcription factor n=1 Tax=Streptomyces coeruleorubidus TaxID=116188 RepID=UPI00237F29B8|nr:response regulator transcription factor [Streptomyces coeruleorubidus]WDV49654.1 response regulator transcription factor [Streptomyces coeruleorubidus]